MGGRSCPTCGRPIDEHDQHVRLVLPDPVLRIPEPELAERTWGVDPLLQVEGVGAFVRVLLPLRLLNGFSLTLGTWLAIDPRRMREVWELWQTAAYARLVLEGYLANAIPPWGDKVLGSPATAAVRDAAALPYVERSEDLILREVLENEWPHEDILAAYESILWPVSPAAPQSPGTSTRDR